jgi:hypothetical protein
LRSEPSARHPRPACSHSKASEADRSVDLPTLENPGQVHFGSGLEPGLESRRQTAAAANVGNTACSLRALKDLRRRVANQLDVLQALYRFHFCRGNLQLAQNLGSQVLIKASIQDGFARDWSVPDAKSSDGSAVRGPARSFVYALKALAFIRLRRSDCGEAAKILLVLQRLDPQHQVGAQVVCGLLAEVKEDCIDE